MVEVKVVLLGNAGVGKTCLAQCYMGNPFEVHSPNVDPAALIRTDVTLNDGTEIKMAIWDTAGQEKYRSMLEMYYRSADAAIICCDKDQIDSVAEFVELVREAEPNVAVFFTLTKSDLYGDEEKQEMLNRLNEKAKELNVKCVLASSAKTEDGVASLFASVAEEGYLVAKGRGPKAEEPATNEQPKRGCC